MASNSKAVQIRIKSVSAQRASGQRKHDLRLGKQPAYIDGTRSHLNRVLIESETGPELRKICEERRSQRDTKRAMKSNASVAVSGIITFGHVAQTFFDDLSDDQQDAAYFEVVEAVAKRLNTTASGLVVHCDEASPHAHFQLAAIGLDGTPVSQIAKRGVLKELQTIAASVMKNFDQRIERGTPIAARLAGGESYADTVHHSAAEMRSGLAEDLPALRAQIIALEAQSVAAEAKFQKNERLSEKAREKAAENDEKAEKALKRAQTYEKRAVEAQRASQSITEQIDALRAAERRLTASLTAQRAELERVEDSLAQKKTTLECLMQKKIEFEAKLKSLNVS